MCRHCKASRFLFSNQPISMLHTPYKRKIDLTNQIELKSLHLSSKIQFLSINSFRIMVSPLKWKRFFEEEYRPEKLKVLASIEFAVFMHSFLLKCSSVKQVKGQPCEQSVPVQRGSAEWKSDGSLHKGVMEATLPA